MKYYLLLVVYSLLVACTSTPEFAFDEQYMMAFENNQKVLLERRHHYLKLAGLFPIRAGVNTLGTTDSAHWKVQITDYPDHIGTLYYAPDSLHFAMAHGLKMQNENGEVFSAASLTLDEAGNSEKFVNGQLSWMVITRGVDKLYLRVWDEQNTAVERFQQMDRFALNPMMVFNGSFSYYSEPKQAVVDSKLGFDQPTVFVGRFSFEHQGQTHELEVGRNGFTMVADPTNSNSTYGGGRYMYLDLPQKDSVLQLDLNLLYNPPCTFSEFTTCLIPPAGNRLPFAVEAGELWDNERDNEH